MKLIAVDRDTPVSYLFTKEEPPYGDATQAVHVSTDPPGISQEMPVGSFLNHILGSWDIPSEEEASLITWDTVKQFPHMAA